MNDVEKRFGKMLADVPCDESIRNEHREQVRELALSAFDDAAADGPHAKVSLANRSQPRSRQYLALRLAFMSAAAASIAGAIFVYQGWRGNALPTDLPGDSDRQLFAAVHRLTEYDGEDAALLDQGLQICVVEFNHHATATERQE